MKKGTFFILVGLIGLMLSSASVAGGNDLGCVSSWGYWMNHNKYQNAYGNHRDPAWDNIGEGTQFYGNWGDPPSDTEELTWFEILLIPAKAGNAYVILAHRYVAAWLNIHRGANPTILGSAMADAAALLAFYSNNNPEFPFYPPAIPKGAANLSGDDWSWAVELASLLGQFNSGTLPGGPLPCGK